jgi:hypothetical protein
MIRADSLPLRYTRNFSLSKCQLWKLYMVHHCHPHYECKYSRYSHLALLERENLLICNGRRRAISRAWHDTSTAKHSVISTYLVTPRNITYLFTELSPSWETANCAATQELPQHFMEPEGSLSCSQEPSTGPYPKPDRSSPVHTIPSYLSKNWTELRGRSPQATYTDQATAACRRS